MFVINCTLEVDISSAMFLCVIYYCCVALLSKRELLSTSVTHFSSSFFIFLFCKMKSLQGERVNDPTRMILLSIKTSLSRPPLRPHPNHLRPPSHLDKTKSTCRMSSQLPRPRRTLGPRGARLFRLLQLDHLRCHLPQGM